MKKLREMAGLQGIDKMKITKRQLRRIIKEEKARLIGEARPTPWPAGHGRKVDSRGLFADAIANDLVDHINEFIRREGLDVNQPEVARSIKDALDYVVGGLKTS